MPTYIAVMTISIIAPSLSEAAKAIGIDNLEFESDTDDIKTIHVDLSINEIKE